jgi:hypothetical protein
MLTLSRHPRFGTRPTPPSGKKENPLKLELLTRFGASLCYDYTHSASCIRINFMNLQPHKFIYIRFEL